MTTDPLDRLRASDPAPHGSQAPPLETMLARIAALDAPAGPRSPRRRRWLSVVGPTFALGATAAVVVVVLIAVGHHRSAARHPGRAASRPHPAVRVAPPSPAALAPRSGGMRGPLSIYPGVFDTPLGRLIEFSQADPGGSLHNQAWQATSAPGGGRWTLARRASYPFDLADSGDDAWYLGLQVQVTRRSAGYVRFFVSHDGGRHWATARSDPHPSNYGGLTIAGGEVWSLGATGTSDVVLHGRADGDALTPTAAQPPLHDSTNVEVIAVSATSAYVTSASLPNGLWRTEDAGRSWRRLADPCPKGYEGEPEASPTTALWTRCEPAGGGPMRVLVRRAIDGGRAWRTVLTSHAYISSLVGGSAQVAWLLTADGHLLRTADGGRTWPTVWYGGRPEPTETVGDSPSLGVRSADAATVVAAATRGRAANRTLRTNLVAYTTTDGGRSWSWQVIHLPTG